MDNRVILGEAPANSSIYYNRSGEMGLFVSKPGANAMNCPDGDLTFDSTAPGLVQMLAHGRAIVPPLTHKLGLFGRNDGVLSTTNPNPSSGPTGDARYGILFPAGNIGLDLALKDSWLPYLGQDFTDENQTDLWKDVFVKIAYLTMERYPYLKDVPLTFHPDNATLEDEAIWPYNGDTGLPGHHGLIDQNTWHDAWRDENNNQVRGWRDHYNPWASGINVTLFEAMFLSRAHSSDYSKRSYFADMGTYMLTTEGRTAVHSMWTSFLTYARDIQLSTDTTVVANRSNWGYSSWEGGKVTITTGKPTPSILPVHMWWNPISSSSGNTVTNLSFLDVGDHVTKDSETGLIQRPGTNLQSRVYVEDIIPGEPNEIVAEFTQSSTTKYPMVHYTMFREIGIPTRDDFDIHLTFIASDVSVGGDCFGGRLNSDGTHYTITFPDDFVGTKGADSDPFKIYRDSDNKINARCSIRLVIPEGTIVSGNSYDNFIPQSELVGGGTTFYGPTDSLVRFAYELEARVDPCIKLNLSTVEWDERSFDGMNITIENYGTVIGGGGYGMFGLKESQPKLMTQAAGGGGGGGQGYHPEFTGSDSIDDWSTGADSGPKHYVEWGPTTVLGFFDISTNSIGPGKGGTGYLGATKENPTAAIPNDGTTRIVGSGPGTGDPDGSLAAVYGGGWLKIGDGNPGSYGTRYAPGAGGADKFFMAHGHGNALYPAISGGSPRSGHGGSCVYLFCNTTTSSTGTQVTVINKSTGILKSGGGGGSGAVGFGGLGGGALGEPAAKAPESDISPLVWTEYTRRGEPGKFVFWSSENLQKDYTVINENPDERAKALALNSYAELDDGVGYNQLHVVGSSFAITPALIYDH